MTCVDPWNEKDKHTKNKTWSQSEKQVPFQTHLRTSTQRIFNSYSLTEGCAINCPKTDNSIRRPPNWSSSMLFFGHFSNTSARRTVVLVSRLSGLDRVGYVWNTVVETFMNFNVPLNVSRFVRTSNISHRSKICQNIWLPQQTRVPEQTGKHFTEQGAQSNAGDVKSALRHKQIMLRRIAAITVEPAIRYPFV